MRKAPYAFPRFREDALCRGLAGAACIAAMAVWFVSTPYQAQQRALATHHVPAAVVRGQAPLVSPLPSEQRLKLSIALPLRNPATLNTLLHDLYDPRSPSFRKYLTVQEFTDRFGPAPGDYAAALEFAKASGMTVTGITSNRLLIHVEAAVAAINKTFHVTMGTYQHPTEHRTFYAPDREPSVDLAVPLWHISGLDNFSLPRRYQTGSGMGGSFLGSDFRVAYGATALTGAGQTIGLYGAPFNLSDVQAYFNTIGQPFNPAVVQVVSTGGVSTSCTPAEDCGEPAIDIEQALSMAPGVNAVIEYEGPNDAAILNLMATDDVAKQLSGSIGMPPQDTQSNMQYFQEFKAQGQSFFFASGDGGAYSSSNTMNCPVDEPLVTTVGGTVLTTTAQGAWASETAWSNSGGGISTNNIPIPTYQQLTGVINQFNQGSTTLRNVPDVSMEASDDYVCANGSCGGNTGGTSFAAPRWAGFMALVNQQAALLGKPPIGFLNPTIYQIGTTPARYQSDFHDIATGSNGLYSAVVGYDLVTGWGSPNGLQLITDLAGTVPCSPAWTWMERKGLLTLPKVYSAGAQASYEGVNYTAAFQNIGTVPPANSGPSGSGKAWIQSGICNATSAATQVIPAVQTPTHPLSAMFNITGMFVVGGVYADGDGNPNPGLDGKGNAYSRTLLLGTSITSPTGAPFTLGQATTYNAVSAVGQTITLPPGSFSSLAMLGTGVNGAQTGQFTVTYTDGTTTVITQTLSAWTQQAIPAPQNESVALSMTYCDTASGGITSGSFNLYEYSWPIDNKKTVASLTLPNNYSNSWNVCVLALALVP